MFPEEAGLREKVMTRRGSQKMKKMPKLLEMQGHLLFEEWELIVQDQSTSKWLCRNSTPSVSDPQAGPRCLSERENSPKFMNWVLDAGKNIFKIPSFISLILDNF